MLRLIKKMAHIFPPYIDIAFTLLPETLTRGLGIDLVYTIATGLSGGVRG